MATLYFKVGSDWEEVVRLRQECEKLENQLKKMDSRTAPIATKALETELASTKQQMMGLVTEAAKAGAVMENGFKKKIFDASQTVNGLSEKITLQRGIIQKLKDELSGLKDKYREALKQDKDTYSLESSIKLVSGKLREQKSALFDLTQEQANARLSVKKLRDEYELFRNDGEEVVKTSESIGFSLNKALAVAGGIAGLKQLGSEIIRVRGEFQEMETAIETMVGKDMANTIMPQIKELAKISPLTMSDMVGAEKMMLGFNIQAEDTIKYLKALSDLSMGSSTKFNSLALAFSQMSAAGKLMGGDLNQMINAGFNPLQVISEKTGKSIATLKDEMSKGAVSAEMVQQAFIDATSAGGKFYQMSENASKTINGQISMMQDAMDAAFNEMGMASEGVIMKAIQVTTSLIQNYETIGKVLVGLVTTYGVYRTAVMLNTIAVGKHTIAEVALTNARVLARKAQLALNAAMLANPYVAVATVVTGLVATMWAFHDSSTAAEKAQKRFNKKQEEATRQAQEHKQKIDALIQSSRDIALSDSQRGESLAELRKEYPKIFAQYDIESIKLADILKLKQQIAEEDAKRAVKKEQFEYEAAKKAVKDYSLKLTAKQINGGRITKQEENELKELEKFRDEFLVKRGKGISEQFIANLKNIDISEFDKYITELEKKIKGKGENGTVKLRLPIDIKGTLSDKAVYNVKDIKTLIDTVKSTKQTRIDSEKNKTTYKQDYEKAKKEWEDAKKKLYEIEKDKDKFTSKQYEDAKKRVETTEKKYKDLGGITGSSLTKQENKAVKDAKAQKREQQRLYDELLKLRFKNQQDEINLMKEGSEKKRRQIELDYQKEIDAYNKAKSKYGETDEVKAMKSNAEVKRSSSLTSIIESENQAAIEANERYLKEYGTFLQKRDAITSEYTRKISEAVTQGDKNILQKQMEEALSSLNLEKLKQGINWELIFGDLDKVSKESLNKVKQQLKDFKNSEEYKDMAIDQKKVIDEALNNIQTALIDKGGLLGDLPYQLNELAKAQEELEQAQDEYNEAMENGTDTQKEAATNKLNAAQKKQQNAQVNVQRSTDKTVSNLTTLSKVITELGSNSELSLSQIGNLAVSVADVFTDMGEDIGGIIGVAFSLLDAVGTQGLDGFIGNIFGSVFKSVGGIWDTLTFGGFSKLFGIGGNEKEVQETINRLTDRNEKLQSAIESLTEEMKDSKGSEKSVSEYNKAIKYQEEYNKNVLSKAQAQAGYHGKHHSWAYYMGWSDSDIQWIQDNIMSGFTGTESLWQMTPEQMDLLRQNVDLWQKMADSGKGGYGNGVVDALEEYADLAGNLEELKEGLFEQLTGMSFDSMYDSFIDTLMDMDASAEDFADNISEYFMRAMLSDKIGNMYSQKLEDWWNRFGESMKDGNLSENERNSLQNEYMGYVNEALRLRDELAAATGYDNGKQQEQQSASGRGFGTEMTHEDAGELSGRFTAVQESNLRIEAAEQQQTVAITELRGSISSLTAQASGLYNIADETRTILANSYLELQQIRENTGEIVKPIKQIQADIAEVKQNTSRL